MVNFLVRHFVKDYENIADAKVRTSYGILTSMAGIACNVFLFILKLIIGLLVGSISVMADAFNNLSDAASSIIGFVGIKLAQRPADKEHPFGHGRYEYIAALAVAFLVLQVGFSCAKSSIERIINPQKTICNVVAVTVLIISVTVKVWLAYINRVLGKKIKSSVMLATAADAKGDVLITSVTVISLIAGNFTAFPIDGIMGTVVSVFVILAGINIVKDTLEPLIGEAADPDVCRRLEEKILSYDGITGTHDLIIHNYGPTHSMATIHVEVPNDKGFEEAHEVIDRIERDVLKEMNIFLVIHMDPVVVNDEYVLKTKKMAEDIVKEAEPEASIHDFRMVSCGENVNIIFDMVIPYSADGKKEELLKTVTDRIMKEDSRYSCNITIENSYICER